MESEYNKRAREKAEYLLALKQQKETKERNAPSAAPVKHADALPSKNAAMTERERRFEERKRAFMAKKNILQASPPKGRVPHIGAGASAFGSSPREVSVNTLTSSNPFADGREPPMAPAPSSPLRRLDPPSARSPACEAPPGEG